MAMARLNIPSVFVYGGTIMPGILDGKELTVLMFMKQLAHIMQDKSH